MQPVVDRSPVHVDRIALLDHWKLLLIWWVVLGHLLIGHPILESAIYSFHMPAFVFLTGVTSRPRPSWRSQVEIAVLLIAFQGPNLLLMRAAGWQYGRAWSEPAYIMWFFAGLLAWRWSLRPLLATRWPLAVALILALGAGLLPIGVDFSASRTLVFLPFFVAGHLHGAAVTRWVQRDRPRLAPLCFAGLGLAIAFGCARAVGGRVYLLEGKFSYAAMEVGAWQGLTYRAAQLLVAATVSLCFFMAASRPGRWSRFGRNTRQVYLLHGFLVVPLVFGLRSQGQFGRWSVALCLVLATLLVAVLSQPWWARAVERVLRPVVDALERVVRSIRAMPRS